MYKHVLKCTDSCLLIGMYYMYMCYDQVTIHHSWKEITQRHLYHLYISCTTWYATTTCSCIHVVYLPMCMFGFSVTCTLLCVYKHTHVCVFIYVFVFCVEIFSFDQPS